MTSATPVRVTHTLPIAASFGDAAFGGMERHVMDLTVSLVQRGVDADLLLLLGDDNEQVNARVASLRKIVPVELCWFSHDRPWWTGHRRFPLHGAALARALGRRRDRLVHLHVAETDLLQLPIAHLLCRGVVVSQHSAMPSFSTLRTRVEMRVADRMVDRYIAVSTDVRAALVDKVGISPTKIDLVDYGIPPIASPPDRSELRASLGLPVGAFVVGYAGRLVAMKNIDTLIDAAAQVPEVVLAIVGDGPERGALESRARHLENVRFLGYRTDSRELLSAFDLAALVSEWEGKPLALIEAMLCGVPVLGSAVPGTSEALLHGEVGELVPRRDVGAIAAAFRRAATRPADQRAKVQHAREYALASFSSERMTSAVIGVYESIAARAHRRQSWRP